MLEVSHLHFGFKDSPVLKDISFTLEPGENMAIIGESGSGKSTLLNCIHGKFDLEKGNIRWDHTSILGPAFNLVEGYEFMKYVPQEFDLMPYTTVSENVGKYLSNFYPERKKDRIDELLGVVELQDFKNVKVKNLSGGEKQRIALARALAEMPELLLLDEPFSHIDNFKKRKLRRNLFNFLKKENISCLVATHDKEDILGYSGKAMFLNNGRVERLEATKSLYKDPANPLLASFFGEFNILDKSLQDKKPIFFYHSHELEKDQEMYLSIIS